MRVNEMDYDDKIKEIKILVAKFQEETNSNSVLDFCVWHENFVLNAQKEGSKQVRKKESFIDWFETY
jgi:hypothetical protein